MKIRLGYCCISNTLNISTSSPYTYTQFNKEKDYKKLDRIIKSNLSALKEILKYNVKNNIHFYRLTSNLIPLATKEDVVFDYIKPYTKEYNEISTIIKKYNLRVDLHPNEYCVLNSVNKNVVKQSIDILKYQYKILSALNIKKKIILLHVGSVALGKKNAISRFCNQFKKLDANIQKTIAIENDDKTFNIEDCLEISKKIGVPVVFDYHHYNCNKGEKNLQEILPSIIKTWENKTPKMHFSSPKSKLKKEFRSHNDYINVDAFITFLDIIKPLNKDIDIMIEAKQKDEALFKLVRELKYKTNIKFIDDTTFII